MTDRELLELAAKAAEIEVFFDQDGDCYRVKASSNRAYWNPILFDGDALRLAVKLRLVISPTAVTVMAYEPTTMKRGEVYEIVEADPQAATRRAIVRAAAEIGRSQP